MRLIVAGSRDLGWAEPWLVEQLDRLALPLRPSVVLHGGCRGVDQVGGRWAHGHDILVKEFVADWAKHGKAAGPRRNRAMAADADALIAFRPKGKGSPGTTNMVREADARSLIIIDYRVRVGAVRAWIKSREHGALP